MATLLYQHQQQYTYNQYDDDYSSDEEYSQSEIYDLQDRLEKRIGGGARSCGSGSTSAAAGSGAKKQTVRKNSKASTTSVDSVLVTSSMKYTTIFQEQQDVDDGSKKPKEQTVSNHLSATQVKEILDRETENQKKKRLPSSEEVYHRIKWEAPAYGVDIDSFIIGYSDRFLDLIKVPFSAFEIGVIPLHRVMKIYYQDKLIWDRKDRLFDFPFFDQ